MINQKTFSTITIALLIVALLIGAGGGYFISSSSQRSKITDLEDQVSGLNSQVDDLRARIKPIYASSIEYSDNNNIILFSWDGFQRNHLYELLKEDKLPNLKSFLENGVILNLTVFDYLTQTKPGHGQMLTGYRGKDIGVFTNNIMINPIPDGYTLLERIENYFGDDNIVTAMITGKNANIEPVFENAIDDIDKVYIIEGYENYIISERIMTIIERNKDNRFITFFHFKEPDVLGHGFGENSIEYDLGAINDDYWFGMIISKLGELNILNRTLIYITTDHGFVENTRHHRTDADIWMITNDLRLGVNSNESLCNMIDIAPTIYYSLGIDHNTFNPSLKGFPLQEQLPIEADKRNLLLNDTDPPAIILENDKIIKYKTGTDINIRFNVSDINLDICYLLVNDKLLKTYTNFNVTKYNDSFIRHLKINYTFEPSLDIADYRFNIISFDERENMNEIEFQALLILSTDLDN
jgi:hypothetical protein